MSSHKKKNSEGGYASIYESVIDTGYASATARTIQNRTLLLVGAPARFRYDLYGRVMLFDINLEANLYKFSGTQVIRTAQSQSSDESTPN